MTNPESRELVTIEPSKILNFLLIIVIGCCRMRRGDTDIF